MANELIGAELIERLAWSLVHSLWQGAIIALAAASLRLLLPSPRWRYGVSVGALLMMLLAPVVTFLSAVTGGAAAPLHFAVTGGEPVLLALETGGQAAAVPWSQWIVVGWLAGVGVCLLRLLGAWQGTRRLLVEGTAPVPPAAAELLIRLRMRLRLHRPVRLLQSAHIDTPIAIGWLRPAVLLPAAALTGLTPAQLEAVLAHELAHVRRQDFLVNILQRCVESLLFYHPAVWWLSARIRADREDCCDDVALASCCDAATYAGALLELERSRGAGALAMAGTGGNLARRVRRLLQGRARGRDWRDVFPAALLVAALLVTVFSSADGLRAQPAAPDEPEASEARDFPEAPDFSEAPSFPEAPMGPRGALSWVLLHGDTVLMSGSRADVAEARALRQRLGADLLWFQYAQGTYVIHDPQLLQRVIELHAPLQALAEQQAALGEEQSKLAKEMRNVRVEIDTSDLEARLAELAAELPAVASQQELAELQRALGSLQRELGQLQAQAGREQGRIGRMQGEYGRRQGELGREQAEAARRAEREVRELLRQAVETGSASLLAAAV